MAIKFIPLPVCNFQIGNSPEQTKYGNTGSFYLLGMYAYTGYVVLDTNILFLPKTNFRLRPWKCILQLSVDFSNLCKQTCALIGIDGIAGHWKRTKFSADFEHLAFFLSHRIPPLS